MFSDIKNIIDTEISLEIIKKKRIVKKKSMLMSLWAKYEKIILRCNYYHLIKNTYTYENTYEVK